MSERLKFITRLREGERMSDLCREFGISRKTGYKLVQRYGADGAVGLFEAVVLRLQGAVPLG